ncbi:DSBA-like thioredoxin domain-containing protein [Podospora aff. communis PSN243]|uniref:DSBA-like thioredoxin domain-containing protein n=1 Tax=Podospora aff. communis PSN243 TaxID=3040156 RepID=A0AAV9GGT4_9PEZI|nr:DSBA-like thioredoxin domain-containing protein [Podospora aff. communis PSN243]
MANFNIKIVSDVICPWCYIGKRRLEKAIGLYQKTVPGGVDDTFTVTWHPFYLDPSLPKVGLDSKVHMANKFGPERAAMMQTRLLAIGEAEGINFAARGKIGNTRDAHRLVQLAKTKSNALESNVITELFRSHIEEGGDITSHDMLIAAGEKAGLDRSETKKWLEDGKGGAEVDREVEEAYSRGVSGVPNFTINDQYEVSGAQDPETFVQLFLRAKESAPGVSTSSKATSC